MMKLTCSREEWQWKKYCITMIKDTQTREKDRPVGAIERRNAGNPRHSAADEVRVPYRLSQARSAIKSAHDQSRVRPS